MARKKGGKAAGKPQFARLLPLAILAALVVFVGAVLTVFFSSPAPGVFQYPAEEQAGCVQGTARACSVGNCTGTSVCLEGGTWGSCKWVRVCTPGARMACLQDGCSYAYRECNPCGSGYGSCTVPGN
ncbi:MAG: hypothetical protein PHV13_01595 [Candidatus ainarchaeum sp.]|nr:hypothetical protein [Candidatus ainarchaeum sp.]